MPNLKVGEPLPISRPYLSERFLNLIYRKAPPLEWPTFSVTCATNCTTTGLYLLRLRLLYFNCFYCFSLYLRAPDFGERRQDFAKAMTNNSIEVEAE